MAVLAFLVCLVGIFQLATCAPKDAPLPYPVSDLVFSGELGGHQVAFNGTIQQVYAKTLAAHPDFNVHAQITANIASAAKVTKRNKSNHFCSQDIGNPWRPAKVDKIVDGIHYLQNKARCGVNPRSCARISCSWDSAIFLCNDRNDFIQPSCAYLASYASDIINFCHQDVNGIGIAVAGQEFDTENYNVLVRYSNC